MFRLLQARTTETLMLSNEKADLANFETQLRKATRLRITVIARITLHASSDQQSSTVDSAADPPPSSRVPTLEYHVRVVDCTSAEAIATQTPNAAKHRNLLSKVTNGRFGEGKHRADVMYKLRRFSSARRDSSSSFASDRSSDSR